MDRSLDGQNSSEYLLAVSESSNAVCLVGGSNQAERSTHLTKSAPKIVDGVTTWLPSSSNIQLSSKTEWDGSDSTAPRTESQSSLLQSVLELDGRRYIIVPKESIVSISPNANATINTFDEFERTKIMEEGSVSDPVPATVHEASPTNALSAASIPNSFLVNPSSVNSFDPALSSAPVPRLSTDGVGSAVIDSPPYYSSDNRNQTGIGRIRANAHG